uniref:Uncharacterized protein n=1 Tax=Caenorhabditis japonica TaxID=281687 RepID=A0A8R1HQJ6_CAEJA
MWLLDIIAKLFPIEHSFWHVNFSLVDQKEIEYLINFEFFKNCRDLEIWDKQVDGKILDKTIRAIESLKSLTVWWDLSHDFPHETIFSTVERVHYNRALALTPRDLECFEKCQYLTIKNTNFEEDSINELLWQLIEYEHDPPKEISILLKSCSTLEPHKVFSGFAVIRLKGESHSYLIINDDACDNPKTAFKVSLNQAIKRVVITDWHHPKIEHIYEMLRCMDGKTDARLELGYNKIQAQNLRIKCESVDKEFEDKNLQEFKNIRNQNIEAKCRLRFFARTIRSMGGELCKDGFYEYQLNDEECDQECH